MFLDSPAGVGFSYTNTSSDLKDSGDERTGQFHIIMYMFYQALFVIKAPFARIDYFNMFDYYEIHVVIRNLNIGYKEK